MVKAKENFRIPRCETSKSNASVYYNPTTFIIMVDTHAYSFLKIGSNKGQILPEIVTLSYYIFPRSNILLEI